MVVWLVACPGYRWLWPWQGHEAEGESLWGSGHNVRATDSIAVASWEGRRGPIFNLCHRWPLDTCRIRRPQLWAGAIHNLPCEGHRESQRWRRGGHGDRFDALQPSVRRSCKKCWSQQQLWDQRGRLRKGGRWRLGNEIRRNCCGARLPWSIHRKWDVGGDQALHCNEQVLNPKHQTKAKRYNRYIKLWAFKIGARSFFLPLGIWVFLKAATLVGKPPTLVTYSIVSWIGIYILDFLAWRWCKACMCVCDVSVV